MATTITGLGPIQSFTGPFPAPIQMMLYFPRNSGEVCQLFFAASRVRGWVRDAAKYLDVPHVLAATILQQENNPRASNLKQFLQFGERFLTTGAAIVDALAFDLVPDRVAKTSSGIANLCRPTLRDAANYIERVYKMPVIPDDVKYMVLGLNLDQRIQGFDWHCDLYYMCAYLRQLIDRKMNKNKPYQGPLTLEQVQTICAAYNGSGPDAATYAQDAVKRMTDAAAGKEPLYFYET
jgi:hypothetical protein